MINNNVPPFALTLSVLPIAGLNRKVIPAVGERLLEVECMHLLFHKIQYVLEGLIYKLNFTEIGDRITKKETRTLY